MEDSGFFPPKSTTSSVLEIYWRAAKVWVPSWQPGAVRRPVFNMRCVHLHSTLTVNTNNEKSVTCALNKSEICLIHDPQMSTAQHYFLFFFTSCCMNNIHWSWQLKPKQFSETGLLLFAKWFSIISKMITSKFQHVLPTALLLRTNHMPRNVSWCATAAVTSFTDNYSYSGL